MAESRHCSNRWSRSIEAPAARGDAFGSALRLSGDTLVVGAFLNDDLGKDAGRAYVYRRSAWQWRLEAPLAPKNADAGDHFGRSVAISGDRIVVSAPDEALSRASKDWKLSGSAGASRSRWSPLDYDPTTRTLALAGGAGVSMLTVK